MGTHRASIEALQPFLERDLRTLDDTSKEELKKALSGLYPKSDKMSMAFAPQPWYLWQQKLPGGRLRYILFEGQPIFMIPGTSSATVRLLDVEGVEVGHSSFSTGWRINLDSASLRQEPALGVQVIEVRTQPVINGADIVCQIYGILEDRVALLRLEDSKGNVLVNNYYNPNHTIGPEPPVRSAEEWEQSLKSNDPVVVLEALKWVGGSHRTDPAPPPPNIGIEGQDETRLSIAVRQRPGVREAIKELAQSNNEWIKEAAQQAEKALN